MRISLLCSVASLFLASTAAFAQGEGEFPATLTGLMKIRDPDNKARKPLNEGVLTFPFFTIENVDRIDETHIIVSNDNNLPFSSSRDPNKADDNEFVLLEVGDFLKAK